MSPNSDYIRRMFLNIHYIPKTQKSMSTNVLREKLAHFNITISFLPIFHFFYVGQKLHIRRFKQQKLL